jgi:hypothetical protein
MNATWHPNLMVVADCAQNTPCASGTAPEPLNATQYDRPLLALYGMISDVVANYNLDRNGVEQAQGTAVKRNYGLNSYEFYGQDTWRIKPNLTLTYGLRWSLFPPPWETNGLQTAPTFGLGTQFNKDPAFTASKRRISRREFPSPIRLAPGSACSKRSSATTTRL